MPRSFGAKIHWNRHADGSPMPSKISGRSGNTMPKVEDERAVGGNSCNVPGAGLVVAFQSMVTMYRWRSHRAGFARISARRSAVAGDWSLLWLNSIVHLFCVPRPMHHSSSSGRSRWDGWLPAPPMPGCRRCRGRWCTGGRFGASSSGCIIRGGGYPPPRWSARVLDCFRVPKDAFFAK